MSLTIFFYILTHATFDRNAIKLFFRNGIAHIFIFLPLDSNYFKNCLYI